MPASLKLQRVGSTSGAYYGYRSISGSGTYSFYIKANFAAGTSGNGSKNMYVYLSTADGTSVVAGLMAYAAQSTTYWTLRTGSTFTVTNIPLPTAGTWTRVSYSTSTRKWTVNGTEISTLMGTSTIGRATVWNYGATGGTDNVNFDNFVTPDATYDFDTEATFADGWTFTNSGNGTCTPVWDSSDYYITAATHTIDGIVYDRVKTHTIDGVVADVYSPINDMVVDSVAVVNSTTIDVTVDSESYPSLEIIESYLTTSNFRVDGLTVDTVAKQSSRVVRITFTTQICGHYWLEIPELAISSPDGSNGVILYGDFTNTVVDSNYTPTIIVSTDNDAGAIITCSQSGLSGVTIKEWLLYVDGTSDAYLKATRVRGKFYYPAPDGSGSHTYYVKARLSSGKFTTTSSAVFNAGTTEGDNIALNIVPTGTAPTSGTLAYLTDGNSGTSAAFSAPGYHPNGVTLNVDLGEEQTISRVAARFNGSYKPYNMKVYGRTGTNDFRLKGALTVYPAGQDLPSGDRVDRSGRAANRTLHMACNGNVRGSRGNPGHTIDYFADVGTTNDAAITLNGFSTVLSNNVYDGGTARSSATSGHYIEYTFTATNVLVSLNIGTAQGKCKIWIDGVAATGYTMSSTLQGNVAVTDGIIDCYYASNGYAVARFYTYNLTNAQHTIKVEVLNQKNASSTGYNIGVDGFYHRSSSSVDIRPLVARLDENGYPTDWLFDGLAVYANYADTNTKARIDAWPTAKVYNHPYTAAEFMGLIDDAVQWCKDQNPSLDQDYYAKVMPIWYEPAASWGSLSLAEIQAFNTTYGANSISESLAGVSLDRTNDDHLDAMQKWWFKTVDDAVGSNTNIKHDGMYLFIEVVQDGGTGSYNYEQFSPKFKDWVESYSETYFLACHTVNDWPNDVWPGNIAYSDTLGDKIPVAHHHAHFNFNQPAYWWDYVTQHESGRLFLQSSQWEREKSGRGRNMEMLGRAVGTAGTGTAGDGVIDSKYELDAALHTLEVGEFDAWASAPLYVYASEVIRSVLEYGDEETQEFYQEFCKLVLGKPRNVGIQTRYVEATGTAQTVAIGGLGIVADELQIVLEGAPNTVTMSDLIVTAPAIVSSLIISYSDVSSSGCGLSWEIVRNPAYTFTNYKVYRDTVPEFTPGVGNLLTTITNEATTTYTDTTANYNTAYYYKVVATTTGEEITSNEVSITTLTPLFFTHILDAIVKETKTITHTLDASVKATITTFFLINGSVRDTFTKTHQIDVFTKVVEEKQYTTDSIVAERSTTTNTIIGSVSARNTTTHTIDCNIAESNTTTNSITAYVNAAPVRLFSSGFEDSNFVQWDVTSGTPALTASTDSSFECVTSTTEWVSKNLFDSNQTKIGYVRFYLRLNQYPSASTVVFRFLDLASTQVSGLKLEPGGKLRGKRADGTDAGYYSGILNLNQWYRIDFVYNGTTGNSAWAVDGEYIDNYDNSSIKPWCKVQFGCMNTSSVYMWFDDIAVDDGTGWINAGLTDNITNTIDAIVTAYQQKTHTADGIVVDRLTATHTVNAVVRATYTATNTIDLSVQSAGESTQDLDGIIFAEIHKLQYIEGTIIQLGEKTNTITGFVRDTLVATHTLTAIVRSTYTTTNTLVGSVLERFSPSHSLGGIVLSTETRALPFDGIVADRVLKPYQITAYVAQVMSPQMLLEGIVLEYMYSSNDMDGIVKQTFQTTYTLDAVVRAQFTSTNTVDARVSATEHEFHSFDGIVFATQTSTNTITGSVSEGHETTHELDAEVTLQYVVEQPIEGFVVEPLESTLEIDGIIAEIMEATNTITGYVASIKTASITIDGEITVEKYQRIKPYAKVIRRL